MTPTPTPTETIQATRDDAVAYARASDGDPSKLLDALIRLIAEGEVVAMRLSGGDGSVPAPKPVLEESQTTYARRVGEAARVFANYLGEPSRLRDVPLLGADPTRYAPLTDDGGGQPAVDAEGRSLEDVVYVLAEAKVAETGLSALAVATAANRLADLALNMGHSILGGRAYEDAGPGERLAALQLFGNALANIAILPDVYQTELAKTPVEQETRNA